ncbi:hypothetical protein JQ604_20260 [Bradyrhizobium jicamae]|uniref:hypothetical protein n=1 Tax=Bradyrhizobium jicamae TaxID=280332 RepID=UPI001BAC2112|nr:hypothetical protein [Bradyrhizobium jicamae]MBR0754525.1 hypothetical protein [Bradyrhizobium jicamae]
MRQRRANGSFCAALIVLGAVGFAAAVPADQLEPSKVRTIRIGPQAADDQPGSARSLNEPRFVRTIPVKPAAAEKRNVADREWSGTPGTVDRASDSHRIRTQSIRSDGAETGTSYNRFVPGTASSPPSADR